MEGPSRKALRLPSSFTQMHDDGLACDLIDRSCSGLAHDREQFTAQDFEYRLGAGLAERGQSPGMRPANPNGRGPQSKGLEDICAAPDATVHNNRNLAGNTV